MKRFALALCLILFSLTSANNPAYAATQTDADMQAIERLVKGEIDSIEIRGYGGIGRPLESLFISVAQSCPGVVSVYSDSTSDGCDIVVTKKKLLFFEVEHTYRIESTADVGRGWGTYWAVYRVDE